MEQIMIILPILVGIALAWLTYLNINYLVTVIKSKKKDHTYTLCLNTVGKVIYSILLIVYVVLFIGGLTYLFLNFNTQEGLTALNVVTVYSILVAYMTQSIIFIGKRHMLVGRVELDYRKIKRVQFPKSSKMHFTYGMDTYSSSVRFADDSLLKKAITKTR